MSPRWLVVLLTAAALVVTPLVVGRRPATVRDLPVAELVSRIAASGSRGWSGSVSTTGGLQVPDSDSFATLGTLLGENTRLRAWWRGAEDWRVDRIRSTGETDLFRQGGTQVRWVFESETATVAPVSQVRLPDAPDLLPPTLGRFLLQGARPEELAPLPAERVAGVDAAGLRLRPAEPASTVDHVDVWADPDSGLPLRVELFGREAARAVLTTTLTQVQLAPPAPETTRFRPPAQVRVDYEESTDVAAAANAFARYDLPATLGGLASRGGRDPGAVGVYGRGPTTVIALPLRRQVAGPLRERLSGSAAAEESAEGTFAPVGPVGVLVTPGGFDRAAFLLAGTVTADTLLRAARELEAAA
jgi:hypothetical protein